MKLHRIAWALLGSGILMFITALAAQSPARATVATAYSALPGDVVINEVAWMGTVANSIHEWIELYNNTADAISLAGWRVTTVDGMNLILHGEIGPHSYYLIERSSDTAISDIPADWVGTFGGSGLHNDGEAITLRDAPDTIIDTANASGGLWPGGSNTLPKFTMERIDSTAPDTPGNWAAH